jgi:hypothetical protein
MKRRCPDSPLDTESDRKRQKELSRLSDGEFLQLLVCGFLNYDTEELHSIKELYERINMISEEPTKYSDPNEVFDLPFPSVNEIPPRFSLLAKREISYMGREPFSQVWKTFGIVESNPHQRQAIYVYGGKGLGKSYILAALACLLVRKGTQVVYLPDCRSWLFDPLRYLRNALVFAFINSKLSSAKKFSIARISNPWQTFARGTRTGCVSSWINSMLWIPNRWDKTWYQIAKRLTSRSCTVCVRSYSDHECLCKQ